MVERPRRARAALRVGLAVLVSAAVITVLLSQLDWSRSWAAIRAARLEWIGAAVGWSCLIVLARGLRWNLVLPGPGVALSTAAIGVQTFFNRIAPMRLGELSLPFLLRRFAGSDASRVLVLLVLTRVVELAVAVALVIAAALLHRGGTQPAHLLALAGLLAAIAVVLVQFRRVLRIGLSTAALAARWSRLDRVKAVQGGLAGLEAAVGAEARLSGAKRTGLLVWTMLIQALQIAAFHAVLRAFGVALDPAALVLGAAVALAGPALPLPSVGTIGTLEASWVAGFVWAGLDLETAILTGVATQLLTLLFAAVIALPSWAYLLRRGPRSR